MSNQTAAMLVIADEILSGRTRDANGYCLAGKLTEHGIDLHEMRTVRDDSDAITTAVQHLSKQYDHVFTSGGIGPTHDDITADCIAAAFDVPIDVRDDARAILQAYYDKTGRDFTTARQRMARIPEGASLIDNPVSGAPGFSLGNVHVLAGVPNIFNAMLDAVLMQLTKGTPLLSRTLRVERAESAIAEPLSTLVTRFTDISFGSYPFVQHGKFGSNIVIRSTNSQRLDDAIQALYDTFPEAT